MNKTINNKAWWLVVPVLVLVAFNAFIPLMTVVNYAFQETFGDNVFFWEGTTWFEAGTALEPFSRFIITATVLYRNDHCHRSAAWHRCRSDHAAQQVPGCRSAWF